MWEHAEAQGALLVFAEHRFFGESWPCGGEAQAVETCLHLMTHEQVPFINCGAGRIPSKEKNASPKVRLVSFFILSILYFFFLQAMADYVQLLDALKASKGAEASPVIVFGGSYGGMLAAWLRAKYPSSFAGAISASGENKKKKKAGIFIKMMKL